MEVVRSLFSIPAKGKGSKNAETSRIQDARDKIAAFRRRKALKAKIADARLRTRNLEGRRIADDARPVRRIVRRSVRSVDDARPVRRIVRRS